MTSISNFSVSQPRRTGTRVCLLFTALAVAVAIVSTGSRMSTAADDRPALLIPDVDAARGRKLFVAKGCVTCHSVNGVGGMAAPALDAPDDGRPIDLLEFAARMWRGAAAMQDLQSFELGYRIELSGSEIGDLGAFASDPAAQEGFSIDEVPDLLKDWFLDQAYWEEDNWPATDEWRFPMEAN